LRKAYGRTTAVHDVSLTVGPGEIVGILGPNGSGKTTTVECLQGLRRADGGDVRVLGLDPRTQVDELRPRIGCQLQDAALPERLRVGEAVRLFAAVGGRPVDVEAVLAEWGLADKRRASFGSLSGGQRQRLFVALALVNRPELVFLDEMTTGLDPAARRDTWRLVERVRELGAAIVLVTHFMDEAERLCDRLVVLREGRVVAAGTPAELVRRHGGGLTAGFTADVDLQEVARLPGVREVTRRGGVIEVGGEAQALLHLGHLLVEAGTVPRDLVVRPATLEDAYIRLLSDRGEPT
jgi:ABC-2 type transport system ATP-binding protein